jgi:hypothetical protein
MAADRTLERELARIRAVSSLMREVGLTQYGDFVLAPPRVEKAKIELSVEEKLEREERERERRHRTLFAASSIVPNLRPTPRIPSAVVQRVVNARERGSGGSQESA